MESKPTYIHRKPGMFNTYRAALRGILKLSAIAFIAIAVPVILIKAIVTQPIAALMFASGLSGFACLFLWLANVDNSRWFKILGRALAGCLFLMALRTLGAW